MEQEQLVEQIKGIGTATQNAVAAAEARINASLEAKSATAKDEAVKAAQEIVNAVKDSISETDKKVGELSAELTKTKDDLKKEKAKAGTGINHSLAVTIADSIMAELKKPESAEKLKAVATSDVGTEKVAFNIPLPDLSLKAPATMTRANVTGDNAILSTVEPGLTNIARRSPFIRMIVNVGRTSKEYVKWTEKTNVQGGAASTAENTKKNQASFSYHTNQIQVKKITEFIKVTTEALEDIDEAEADIRSELVETIELELDRQLLLGDGTGNDIKGIDAWAVNFSYTGPGLPAPNESDVVRIGVAVMANNHFRPSHVLINPVDAGRIDVDKAVDGHYLNVPFAKGNSIAGVAIVENPGVPAGFAYLLDGSKVNVRIRKELTLKVGFSDDDFTNNRVTFLAELRAAEFVKTNHANAVVKINFDDAKSLLESGAASSS